MAKDAESELLYYYSTHVGKEKTVFIIISRAFLIRNMLRSGLLTSLQNKGYRVVVFFHAKKIPPHICKEFENEKTELHAFDVVPHWFHRRVNIFKRYLVDTEISNMIIHFETRKREKLPSGLIHSPAPSLFSIWRKLITIKVLSHTWLPRRLFRFAEKYFFPQKSKEVQKYFDEYEPDIVISTSLISGFDVLFLKEAARRKVPSISMPKGWDNVTKEYYPFLPDWFAAQNKITAEKAHTLQGMRSESIKIVGMPQFDWYARPEIRKPREEHLTQKGLDPARKTIFFGSEGVWSQNDWRIAELIYTWIIEDKLSVPSQLFIRPHYSDVQSSKFDFFRDKPHVFVDDYAKVEFLADKWDPNIPDTIDFTNSLFASDVVVNIASSLALDGACVDKPIVLIGFGCEFQGEKDISIPKLYGTDHMRWLLETGGAPRVSSKEALFTEIERAFSDPGYYAEGREVIRNSLCYKVDGNSSERISSFVDEVMAKEEATTS